MSKTSIGLTVASAVVAVGALATFVLLGSPIHPPKPKAEPPAPARASAPGSVVIVPLAIPVREVVGMLERSVPQTFGGTRDDPVRNPIVEDVLIWSATRAPFSASVSGDAVSLATTLAGTAKIDGKIQPARPSAQPPREISQQAKLAASVSGSLRLALTSDWRLAPELTLASDVKDGSIRIGKLPPISLRNEVQPKLDEALAGLRATLETALGDNPAVEAAAKQAWDGLCAVREVSGGEGNPPVWLRIRPLGAAAGEPRIDGDMVHLAVSVTAETELSSHPSERTPCEFPKLDAAGAAADARAALAVRSRVGYDRVVAAIEGLRVGPIHPGSVPASIEISSVAVEPDGERLLAGIGFSAKEDEVFGSRTRGTLYLRAKPALDPDMRSIVFREVTVDPASQEALIKAGALGEALGPALVRAIEANARVDIAGEAEKAKERATAAVAALSDGTQGGPAFETARMDEPRPEGVAVDATGLEMIMTARGALGLKERTLSLGGAPSP